MAQIVDRNAKHLQILEAAVKCFAKSGFEATSMDDIAAAAGVSKGSLYNYFSDKDEMFYAVFEWIQKDHLENTTAFEVGQRTPRQNLFAFIESTVEGSLELIEIYPITMEVWASAGRSKSRTRITAALQSFYQSYHNYIASLIAAGKATGEIKSKADASVLAAAILAVIDGFVLQYWLNPGFDPRKAMKVFLDALFDGIAPS